MKEEEIDKLTDEITDVILDKQFDLSGLPWEEIEKEIKAILRTAMGDNNKDKRMCRFFKYCVFASITSRTCINDGGSDYCGVYQELSKRGAKRASWFSRLVKDVTK